MAEEDAKEKLEALSDSVAALSQAIEAQGEQLVELLDLRAELEELEQGVVAAESAVYGLLKSRESRGETEALSEYCDVLERELSAGDTKT